MVILYYKDSCHISPKILHVFELYSNVYLLAYLREDFFNVGLAFGLDILFRSQKVY